MRKDDRMAVRGIKRLESMADVISDQLRKAGLDEDGRTDCARRRGGVRAC